MKLLRDLKETTRLLILLEIVNNRPRTLNSIAEELDITVQGASDYVRAMVEEGLVKKIGGEYRATKKGVEMLEKGMFKLKEFVDSSIKQLEIIETCGAIAGNEITKDDEVGLFMKDGFLVAFCGKDSPSKGFAMSDAKPGEDLAVKDMSGMVALKPGRITVLQLPSLQEGGSQAISIKHTGRIMKAIRHDRIAVMDIVSKALVNSLELRPDFEFAPLASSFEAAVRGMDVLVIASRESVPAVVSGLEAENGRLEDPIQYEVKTLT